MPQLAYLVVFYIFFSFEYFDSFEHYDACWFPLRMLPNGYHELLLVPLILIFPLFPSQDEVHGFPRPDWSSGPLTHV